MRHRTTLLGVLVAAGVAAAGLATARAASLHNAELHVLVETMAATVVSLVAFLAIRRARRSADATTALIAAGATATATATWCFAVLPAVVQGPALEARLAWGLASATIFAAGCLLLAALAGQRTLDRRVTAILLLDVPTIAIATSFLVALVTHRHPHVTATAATVTASKALLGVQVVAAAAYLTAATAFVRRSSRFASFLAASMLLLGVSRLAYFRVPSLYVDWVSAADGLRIAGLVVLLVAVAAQAQREAGAVDLARERARIGTEIHRTLTQELALLLLILESGDRDDPRAAKAIEAARRAFALSQIVMDDLKTPRDAPRPPPEESRLQFDGDPRAAVGNARANATPLTE